MKKNNLPFFLSKHTHTHTPIIVYHSPNPWFARLNFNGELVLGFGVFECESSNVFFFDPPISYHVFYFLPLFIRGGVVLSMHAFPALLCFTLTH